MGPPTGVEPSISSATGGQLAVKRRRCDQVFQERTISNAYTSEGAETCGCDQCNLFRQRLARLVALCRLSSIRDLRLLGQAPSTPKDRYTCT